MSHTPGPWKIHQPGSSKDGHPYFITSAGRYEPGKVDGEAEVCQFVRSHEDASLIASAPELLELAKTSLSAIEELAKLRPDTLWHKSEEWAREVIAKATGG